MSNKIIKMLDYIIVNHEGGYVNHPKDPGGPTNFGITLDTLKRLGIDKDGDGDIDASDVRLLQKVDAINIYMKKYVHPLYSFLNDSLCFKLIDLGINMGVSTAVTMLQRVLNTFDGVSVDTDGVFGQQTLNACAKLEQDELYARFKAAAELRYRSIVKRKPSSEIFLKGWLRRLNFKWNK